MKKMILIFSLFISCKNISEYQRTKDKVIIIPTGDVIESAEVSSWRVGPLRRQEVSKGIKVKLGLPQLEKDSLQDLVKNLNIDSWIIRIKRRTLVTNETLDSFYVPLLVAGRGKSDFRIKQVAAGFINIYYSAAAISTRFEKFQCPAFDHRKEITSMKIQRIQGKDKVIRGSKRSSSYYSGRMKRYDYRPFPVNAGKSMNGEYLFEIALFNSADKMIKSNWFELHESVKVLKEKNVSLTGCNNFKIPDPDSSDSINDFKFGK